MINLDNLYKLKDFNIEVPEPNTPECPHPPENQEKQMPFNKCLDCGKHLMIKE